MFSCRRRRHGSAPHTDGGALACEVATAQDQWGPLRPRTLAGPAAHPRPRRGGAVPARPCVAGWGEGPHTSSSRGHRQGSRSRRARPINAPGAGLPAFGLRGVHRRRVSALPAPGPQAAPSGGPCGVRRTRSAPSRAAACGQIACGLASQQGSDGPRQWRGQDRQGGALALSCRESCAVLWAWRLGPQPQDGGF